MRQSTASDEKNASNLERNRGFASSITVLWSLILIIASSDRSFFLSTVRLLVPESEGVTTEVNDSPMSVLAGYAEID